MAALSSARSWKGFVGLRNQGATCYLNSLIQAMFMTPEFRQSLYQLEASDIFCESLVNGNEKEQPQTEDAQAASTSGTSGGTKAKPRLILFRLQQLFAKLQFTDKRAVDTKDLTDSFGWRGNGAVYQQHDVSELNRVFLDAISQHLTGTPGEGLINALYSGVMLQKMKCLECGFTRLKPERFLDLSVPVKGCKTLEQSLGQYFAEEKLEKDNKWRCPKCQHKVDALRWSELHSLPPVITFCLLRFTYNYRTGQRIKIMDTLKFPHVLDLAPYTEPPTSDATDDVLAQQEDDERIRIEDEEKRQERLQRVLSKFCPLAAARGTSTRYSLASVIIHRGGAQQGHYRAYIRDFYHSGQWSKLGALKAKKGNKKGKKKNRQNQQHQNDMGVQWRKADFSHPLCAMFVRVLLREEENDFRVPMDRLGSLFQEENGGIAWGQQYKKRYKTMTKFLKRFPALFDLRMGSAILRHPEEARVALYGPATSANNGKTTTPQAADADTKEAHGDQQPEKAPEEKKKSALELEAEALEEQFPHWFDFNDADVEPILSKQLESQFGHANSKENAYMLVYRRVPGAGSECKDSANDDTAVEEVPPVPIPPDHIMSVYRLAQKKEQEALLEKAKRDDMFRTTVTLLRWEPASVRLQLGVSSSASAAGPAAGSSTADQQEQSEEEKEETKASEEFEVSRQTRYLSVRGQMKWADLLQRLDEEFGIPQQDLIIHEIRGSDSVQRLQVDGSLLLSHVGVRQMKELLLELPSVSESSGNARPPVLAEAELALRRGTKGRPPRICRVYVKLSEESFPNHKNEVPLEMHFATDTPLRYIRQQAIASLPPTLRLWVAENGGGRLLSSTGMLFAKESKSLANVGLGNKSVLVLDANGVPNDQQVFVRFIVVEHGKPIPKAQPHGLTMNISDDIATCKAKVVSAMQLKAPTVKFRRRLTTKKGRVSAGPLLQHEGLAFGLLELAHNDVLYVEQAKALVQPESVGVLHCPLFLRIHPYDTYPAARRGAAADEDDVCPLAMLPLLSPTSDDTSSDAGRGGDGGSQAPVNPFRVKKDHLLQLTLPAHVQLHQDMTLLKLKENVMECEELAERDIPTVYHIRITRLNSSLQPTTVFRSHNSILKHCRIEKSSKLLVEILDHEERLQDSTTFLMCHRRHPSTRTYDLGIPLATTKSDLNSLSSLAWKASRILGLDVNAVRLALYNSSQCTWQRLNEPKGKAKRNKKKMAKLMKTVTKAGDWAVLGVLSRHDDGAAKDDFRTPFDIHTNKRRQNRSGGQSNNNSQRRDDAALVIDVDV